VTCRIFRSLASGTLLTLCLSGASLAQTLPVTGYVQNVPAWSGQTPVARGNLLDLTRIRLTVNPVLGPISINAAYEHLGTLRRRTATVLPGVGAVPAGGEWLDLAWTIADSAHGVWEHRFDRLHLTWSPSGAFQLTVGRQAISWGTTLFLTPADPFVPFLPSDPFREYRAGVDAVRARIYPGPLSEIDLVVRPTKTALGEEWTALARGLTTIGNWELSGWGGTLYGDPAAALGASGSAGSWAVRSEAEVRKGDQGAVFRGTLGVDHLSQLYGRDLYLIVEYQRDGLGAARARDYPMLLSSRTFLRGEHQVLGRDETFVQASYQLHPLWSLAGLWIWNMGDGSSLISPSFTHSAGNNASITGGAFFSTGSDRVTLSRPIPSEYGLAGQTAFVALSLYF
jgi:hypothetical protein